MGRNFDPKIRKRVKSKIYAHAYARIVRRKWMIFIKDRRFGTEWAETYDDYEEIRRAIDRRYIQVKEERERAASGIAPPPSLYQAVNVWEEEFITKNSKIGDGYRATITFAINAFSPEGGDIALEKTDDCVAVLAQRFIDLKAASTNRDGTIARNLRIWKRFFKWCVGMGYLPRNPIDMIAIPSAPKKADAERRYTPEELGRLLRYASEEDAELGRLLHWLLRTGKRIKEARGLKWEHVTEVGFKIYGKRYRGEDRIRYFPFEHYEDGLLAEWQREIREILDAQREISAGRAYVWRWQDRRELDTMMKRVRKKAGLRTDDNRMFHTLRSMAEHDMIFRLGLSPHYTARLVGHSVAVAEASYKLVADEEEMKLGLNRARVRIEDLLRTDPGYTKGRAESDLLAIEETLREVFNAPAPEKNDVQN